jgi:hypothetical protein
MHVQSSCDALATVLLVATTLLIGLAPTDELDARVRVHGESCPAAVLAERVRAQLGGVTTPNAIDVDGTLRLRDDGQWELELLIARGDEEPSVRSFLAPHCDTAIEAGALVVAIAMDPAKSGAVLVPETPAETDPPETTNTPSVASDRASEPSTSTERTTTTPPVPKKRTRKIRGLVRAGGGLDGGALPSAAVMFEFGVGALGPGWRVEATGMNRLRSDRHASQAPQAGGHFTLWAFGARGCGVPRRKTVEFPLCAGFEGGRMSVQGFGFKGASSTKRPWGAVTLGPGVAFLLRPNIAFLVHATLGVPFVHSHIEIVGLQEIWRTGPVFGRGWIGFEGRFP